MKEVQKEIPKKPEKEEAKPEEEHPREAPVEGENSEAPKEGKPAEVPNEGERPKKKPQEAPKDAEKFKKKPERELIGIVRVMETDLPGNKRAGDAIRLISGISFSMGNAIAGVCPFAGKMVGELSEEEIKKLEDMIRNPGSYGIPSWAFNRRMDQDTGENVHLSASKLEITHKMDIGRLKKMRCYRGVRHMQGLPVRGQRTRSSFRKGRTVGVTREKAARTAAKKEAKE